MRQTLEYHPVIGFRFVPDIKARVPHEGGGYLLRTNSTGFRSDRPFTLERSAGTRRILLFGDSFTAGEGVSNGQRYSDHLERLIPNLEVFNYGLPATGLDQHYLIYQEYARQVEHDLLVIAVFVENVHRVGSRYRYFTDDEGQRVLYAKPYFTLTGGQLELHGVPPPKRPLDPADISAQDSKYIFTLGGKSPGLKSVLQRMRRHRRFESLVVDSGLMDFAMKMLRYQPIKDYGEPENASWLVMQALIAKWIGDHPRPVVLMPIPLHHYVYGISSPRAYQAGLRSATEAAGGTFVDPLPVLVQRPIAERKSLYFRNDHHLTKAGHEAVATAVAPALAALLSP